MNNVQQTPRLLTAQDAKRLQPGESFKGIFVISALNKRTDKNGKTYWDVTVTDATGSLDAKVWADAGWLDRSTAELESAPDLLSAAQIEGIKGKTVGVTGKTSDYRGQTQFSLHALSLLNQEKFPPAGLMPRSPVPLKELTARYEALVDGCRAEIADFLRFVYSDERWRAFRDLPAAVNNHHAYANGLLEHTVTVTEAAKALAQTYAGLYGADVDIVVAGSLLHDLGKIEAYKMTPVPEITLAGAVVDHVALGYAMFMQLAKERGLDEDTTLHLAHILLSHHGQKEFGSPVLPATPEALIVSAADELDFRLFCWKDAVKDLLPDQQISQFHFAAQRRFWREKNGDEHGDEGQAG